MNSCFKIYKVYRNTEKTPSWWGRDNYSEVIVVAKDEAQAKGIALKEVSCLRESGDRHRLLSKKDVFVEEIELEIGKILMKG